MQTCVLNFLFFFFLIHRTQSFTMPKKVKHIRYCFYFLLRTFDRVNILLFLVIYLIHVRFLISRA